MVKHTQCQWPSEPGPGDNAVQVFSSDCQGPLTIPQLKPPPPPCAPSLPGPHTPAFLKSALAGNRLTSAGVVSLASGLRQNSTLTTLSLSRNHVADEGAIALARAIECSPSGNPACALRLLSLCDTGVQEPGAEALRDALASNTSLHELDFATNPCLASILAPLHPRVRVE